MDDGRGFIVAPRFVYFYSLKNECHTRSCFAGIIMTSSGGKLQRDAGERPQFKKEQILPLYPSEETVRMTG